MTCIITDDEKNSRETLRHLLHAVAPDMVVLAEAKNTTEAKRFLDQLKPDVLFLDIDMPEQSGIEFLEEHAPLHCQVIFTTAHNEHAVKAFRLNAIDFLLKPIDPDELIAAVQKVEKQGSNVSTEQIMQAKNALSLTHTAQQQRLAIATSEGIHYIEIKDIVWLESMGSYTKICLDQQPVLVTSKGLKEYEELLASFTFIRVHQSNIVNLNHIKRYIKGDGGQLVMSDGTEIEVSRRKKEDVIEALKNLSIN